MCGIVGFVGQSNGIKFIVDGLKSLNYRGYDSAGISVFENGKVQIIKKCGKIAELEKALNRKKYFKVKCAIGHTRWATHGEPSDVNAHPIQVNKVTIVHNGIIENYLQLKHFLEKEGYKFKTQTDTEVAAALIDFFYDGKNCLKAISKAVSKFEGTFAFGIIFENKINNIFAVRKDSSLIVGFGEDENFISSDIIAFSKQTKKYAVLNENEVCILNPDGAFFFDFEGNKIAKNILTIDWNITDVDKKKFDSFMMKEIYEQPSVVERCFNSRLNDFGVNFEIDGICSEWLSKFKRIQIVACGTAMHAGMFGKHLIENLAQIPVVVSIASEFRYCNPVFLRDDLVIIVSQSGETADSLAALRLANKQKISTLAIVNVKTSSIAREADKVIFTNAGPEISVASTKAFSVQLAVFYLIALKFAEINSTKSNDDILNYCKEMRVIPRKMELALNCNEKVLEFAKMFKKTQSMFYIGRGLDYYLALESSLKLKELSYIHSEAYAAGELKHGAISLIEKNMPVIALATQSSLFLKTVNNIKEVKSRGATVFLICGEDNKDTEGDFVLKIPQIDDFSAPFSAIIPMQLFAYNVAKLRGCDVDMPRNLAKSVTVE